MEKVTSFTINHLKLKPGIYVSRIDHVNGNSITTFFPYDNTEQRTSYEHSGSSHD